MAKWNESKDKAADKKAGIKEGSKRDIALDRKRGLPPDKPGAGNSSKKGGSGHVHSMGCGCAAGRGVGLKVGSGNSANRFNPLGGGLRQGLKGKTSSSVKPNVGAGADLSMAQRKKLPTSSFALPGKGEGASGKGSGSYPIPDRGHARSALSRVAQHGTPAEKAQVRSKVKARFGMGQ